MAAPGGEELRLRLTFDYPPPAVPESRRLWFLLDPAQCRAVTDVSAIIRERLYYGRRGALSIYLDGSLLPPGESARVIRDGDTLSVKWEDSRPDNSPQQTAKKRQREEEESEDYRDLKMTRGVHRRTSEDSREGSPAEQEVRLRPKKKHKDTVTAEEEVVRARPKKKGKETPEEEEEVRARPKKKGKETPEEEVRVQPKKKGKEILEEEEVTERPKKKGKETPEEEEVRERPKKKGKVSPEEEEEVRARPKKKGKVSPEEEEVRARPRTKADEVSASQDDDSDDCRDLKKTRGDHTEAKKTKKCQDVRSEEEVSKKNKGAVTPVVEEVRKKNKGATTPVVETSSSSSDQEDRGLSRRAGRGPPVTVQQSNGFSSPAALTKKPLISSPTYNGHVGRGASPLQSAGRGAGRGRGTDNLPWRGRGFRGRGEARPQNHFFYNNSPEEMKEQQLNEDASNVSVLIQNPPVAVNKDYSALPLLAAPPQPGKIIAFKLLELTENYTPEVSDYKEGRILSYDAVSQELEVEVLSQQKKKEPGKFDLIYEKEDGTNMVEYAVPQDRKITQSWSSLIEPRLVTESDHPALAPLGP